MPKKMWSGDVTVLGHSKECIIIDYENEEAFVPYSQIGEDSEITKDSKKGESGEIIIPEWLAEDRGWT